MSNEYGAITLSTANAVGASLKKKMGSLTGYAPVEWAETINKLGNKLPERTVSGAVCSFSDGADDVPMSSVKASITAVQAGSGDPSPSNVRAISGFAECDVVHTGVNIWDEEWEVGYISVLDGKNSSSQVNIRSKNYIPIKPNVSLYLKANIAIVYCPIIFYDKDKNFLSSVAQTLWNRTITTPENACYMRFYMHDSYGTTYNNDISVNYPSTDTSYHSYAGETIPVSFGGQTIYGGELNVTTGVLTVTHGYIASYDGETINEPWISSIDKYVAGNSPSTGAQVVYPLTTPTTIQLTPEEVRSFLGTNNLWANTGDTEVTYYAQPNVPTEVLYKGQISTTSAYATANFTESVADDEEILVKVYCPARSAVDYKVIKVSDIGNGLNVGFNLHTTVNCTITKTSIASYQYSGDHYDIYADVLAYDSAIFN